jgi:hypothetical protein
MPTDINAVSTIAPTASSTEQMAMTIVVFFLSSPKPRPCRRRRNNQLLSAMAVEYAANSIHATGVMNKAIKAKAGETPLLAAIAPMTAPVLYMMYIPRMGPIMGMNITKQMRRLFPKMYCVSAPWSPRVVVVLLRSSLICLASCALIGVKLPSTVTIMATIKTTIAARIRLRRGEALVHMEMLKLFNP